jgi:hypothetical protein
LHWIHWSSGFEKMEGSALHTWSTSDNCRLTIGSILCRWGNQSGRLSLHACIAQFAKYLSPLRTLPIVDNSLHMLFEHGWQPDSHWVYLKQGHTSS